LAYIRPLFSLSGSVSIQASNMAESRSGRLSAVFAQMLARAGKWCCDCKGRE
jgi:hypothetical protein